LIVKVYLAGSCPASNDCSKNALVTSKQIDYGKHLTQQAQRWRKECPSASAVYYVAPAGAAPEVCTGQQQQQQHQKDQSKQGSAGAFMDLKEPYLQQGQRTWCVLDPYLVLPEYLVTFEYQVDPDSPLQQRHVVAASPDAAAAVLERLPDTLLRPTALPLLPWLAVAAEQRAQLCCGLEEEQQWQELLRQGPLPRQRPNLYIASEEMLRKHIVPANVQVSIAVHPSVGHL
jgi:hypothetical protein